MAATQIRFASATSGFGFGFQSPSPNRTFATKSFTFSQKNPNFLSPPFSPIRATIILASTMAAPPNGHSEGVVLPPPLDSTSEPPLIFDGTTRLYISYTCPYAQRVWITRNCKVPSLEHNNEVRGESLDLIKYIDSNFEGPSLFPDDPAKKVFADVLFSYVDYSYKSIAASFREQQVKAETDAAFDFMEDALSKFSDGPFFLGQFSLVDIAYIPFFERFIPFFLEVKNYDLTGGRPTLAKWIQEMNEIEGYKQTQAGPKVLVESYKKRFLPKV